MRKLAVKDTGVKVEFLNRFVDNGQFILRREQDKYELYNDYGCEGSVIVAGPVLSDVNAYLNRQIRRYHLADYWKEGRKGA